MIEIETKGSDIKVSILDEFTAEIKAKALTRAVNKSYTNLRKLIRERYNISNEDIKKHINVYNAKIDDKTNVSLEMRIDKKALPLKLFKAKQMLGGVEASVQKRTPKLFRSKDNTRGSFLQRMKNGYVGAFIRKGKERYPFRQLFGPSIGQLVGGDYLFKQFQEDVKTSFTEELMKELSKNSGLMGPS